MNLVELYRVFLNALGQCYSICSFENIAQSPFDAKVFVFGKTNSFVNTDFVLEIRKKIIFIKIRFY